jgi:hypothetical protein
VSGKTDVDASKSSLGPILASFVSDVAVGVALHSGAVGHHEDRTKKNSEIL